VSRICAQLDGEVAVWRARPLDEQAFPYVFLDAAYCKARVNRRVVSQVVVIAPAWPPTATARCLAFAVGDSRTAPSGPHSYAR
jgi:putative transposase